MRIAVIDDEKYSRVELIHQICQQLPQAEILEAGNGVQAMALLEKESFDILFIDIHLGDMEGTTVASLARRLMPKAKIIFATAYSEYAVTAFELGVNNYILKPFDPARIRQVLEQCRQAQPPPLPGTRAGWPSAATGTPSCWTWMRLPILKPTAPDGAVCCTPCPGRSTPTTPPCQSMKAAWMGRASTAFTRPAWYG